MARSRSSTWSTGGAWISGCADEDEFNFETRKPGRGALRFGTSPSWIHGFGIRSSAAMSPIEFITFKGETIALVFAEPARWPGPRLELLLPFTDVTTAISARETRRTFGQTSRYSFSYE